MQEYHEPKNMASNNYILIVFFKYKFSFITKSYNTDK